MADKNVNRTVSNREGGKTLRYVILNSSFSIFIRSCEYSKMGLCELNGWFHF